MKTRSFYFIISILSTFLSCTSTTQNAPNYVTLAPINDTVKSNPVPAADTLAREAEEAPVDTSTLAQKRAWILADYTMGYDGERLLDLNYDGYKDYLVDYQMQAGTGLKNRTDVYLFAPKVNAYIHNEQLSNVMNPSFYLPQHKITGFYLANGSGDGQKLEWIAGQWVVTKEFTVDNEEGKSVWEISYPQNGKKERLKRPYTFIPPADILETKEQKRH